jgi:hypothetical protein
MAAFVAALHGSPAFCDVGKYQMNNPPNTKMTDQEKQCVVDMYRRGMSIAAVARAVHRSEFTVRAVLNAAGVCVSKTRPGVAIQVDDVPPGIARELRSAAERRNLTPGKLAAALLVGVIRRGSIDRTLAGQWGHEGALYIGGTSGV